MSDRKLGYIPPKRIFDEHRFRHLLLADGTYRVVAHLSSHYDRAATPPPASVDYWSKAIQGLAQMDMNATLGCCVISGKAHLVNVWTANDGAIALANDREIQSTYVSWCGPGDNGCNITSVLDQMKSSGLPMSGVRHKISDYVSVNNGDKTLVMAAIYLFGGLTFGINLPQVWYDNADHGFVWDAVSRNAAIIGGHDISIVGYDSTGIRVSTWGVVGTMTWAAVAQSSIVTEVYAMLSPDWTGDDNLAPNGIDVGTLLSDLQLIERGEVPPLGPQPLPPVPVPPNPTPVPPTPGPTPTPVPGDGPYQEWILRAGEYMVYPGLTATLANGIVTVTGGSGRR